MFGSTQTECVVGRIVGSECYGGVEDSRGSDLSSRQDITLSDFYSVGGERKFPTRETMKEKEDTSRRGESLTFPWLSS